MKNTTTAPSAPRPSSPSGISRCVAASTKRRSASSKNAPIARAGRFETTHVAAEHAEHRQLQRRLDEHASRSEKAERGIDGVGENARVTVERRSQVLVPHSPAIFVQTRFSLAHERVPKCCYRKSLSRASFSALRLCASQCGPFCRS